MPSYACERAAGGYAMNYLLVFHMRCLMLIATRRPSALVATRRLLSSIAPCDQHGPVRLDKLLADRGAGSRKETAQLIRKGRVIIEGETVGKDATLKVPWSTSPFVSSPDGIVSYPPPPLLVGFYKPLGVVSSMADEMGRPDLATVLPQQWRKALHPVGRLDADTTGLLLFSREGELTERLLHPRFVVEREYIAEVDGAIDAAALRTSLTDGVEMMERTARGAEAIVVSGEVLSVDGQRVRLCVTEGKHRMVRRMLGACGHPVTRLHRVRYGEVRLDELVLDEGCARPVEGNALAWALNLRSTAAGRRS